MVQPNHFYITVANEKLTKERKMKGEFKIKDCVDGLHEENELPRDWNFDLINTGSYIAMYSYGNATELFYD